MPTFKGERGPSTWYWLKQFLRNTESHDEIMKMIEQHAEDAMQKGMLPNPEENSDEPINILCIDGGGAKGYAMISIVEELEALYEEQSQGEQSDFISKFDLIAGTSVGGCGALTMNQTSTTDDAIIKGTYFMDMAREHAFANLNLVRLMFTGSATKATQQPAVFSQKLYGENTMLRNEIGLKAFAVSSAISDSEAKKGMKPKPFLLRTYDIPSEGHEIFHGTSSLKLSEAIQGTSSAPVAFDRVRVKVEDEMYTLCDGGLSCNCPVGLALAEAQRIYPNRPFGCILSIGLDPHQDRFAYRAIELARMKTSALHFQRICPLKALESASSTEVDIRKIAQLEQSVRDEIRNDSGVRLRLKKTIKLLLDSPNRRIIEGLEDQRRVFHSRKTPTRLRVQASFDEEILRRQKIRKEVKEGTLARKKSRLRISEVGDTFQEDVTDFGQARYSVRKFLRSFFISMVHHPLYFIFGTLLVTLLISLICLFLSDFELETENKKGWKSRGTEIAKRGMQADILRNNTSALFYDTTGTKWHGITSNVVKGDFPLKEQLSRRFFLNSDQPSSILEDSSCEAEKWYSSADLYAKNNMISLVQAKEISLLEPTSIHRLCIAESITLSVLEDDNLCDCDNCLPPLSLVRLIKNFLGTENRNCEDLAEAYKNVQNEFTEKLTHCANEMKTNMGNARENSTCPSEFSPHLLDSDFGVQGNNFLRYSLSVYSTSTTDALNLFQKEANFGSGGDLIEITYETRFSEFEEYAIDRTIKPDLILAACSGCMVFVVICIHTRSLWLACIGIIQIVFAIPLSYACYRFIFGLKFFSLLNFLGFFISAALGADDIFVACGKFNEVKDRLGRNSPTELVASVAFPEAASAMLLTTATTSIAFFASCISPVAPIFTFSIFCGLMVVFNYVLNIFLVFPALCLLDKWTKDGTKNCLLRFEPVCKSTHDNKSHSRLKGILNRYCTFMHRLRWFLLASCIILFGFALHHALKISVPKNTSVQMLPDSHPLQMLRNIDNEKLLSSTILRATTGSHVDIIFGITPADTGERNYPNSLSTLELDNHFDPSSIEAQDYLVSFCDRLFELPFVYKASEDFKCSINAFESWLYEQSLLPSDSQDIEYITSCGNATSLPMKEESFHPCFIAWSKVTSDTSVLSWDDKVRTLIINLGTRVKFDTPLGETRLEWEKFEKFQQHELTLRSPSDFNFFHTSAIWWWNDTFQMMQSTGLSSLYIAISASSIIILLSSRSPFLAFASAISICFILATSTATLVLLGWELGFLEWICFAILVGLSADFVIHLSHSYSHSPGRLHRHARTKVAILSMGEPIVGATVTTISVSFLMLFCKIVFFVKFAQLLIVTTSFSLLGGLVFHSVLVNCFGPEDPLTTYNTLKGFLTLGESEISGSSSEDSDGKDHDSLSHSPAGNVIVYDLSESTDRKRKVHFQMSQEGSDKDAKDNVNTTSPNKQSEFLYDLGGQGVEEMNIKWSKSPADLVIPFNTFTETYRNGQVLEYGAFSELREVYNIQDNELYAAKIISKDLIPLEDKESMKSEIQVLKTISHKNITRLFDYMQDSHRYYLIYDLHIGGNLFDRIATKQVYTENEARSVCKILFGVLHHLDLNGVVHRDLKPDNIRLMDKVSETNIKLAGFSFARTLAPDEYLKTQCGTPEYVSPEILYGLPYRTKVDMWSIGVILYILLAGYPPFMSQNQRDLFRKIKSGSVSFPDNYWNKVSTEARMLVVGLLSVDPQRRLSASEAMKSKWMTCDEEILRQSLNTNLFRSFQTKQKVRESIVMNVPKTKTTSLGQSLKTDNTEESKMFTEIQESLRLSIAMDSSERARKRLVLDSSSSFPSLKGSIKSIEEDDSIVDRESFYSHSSSLKRLSTSELEEFPC